MRNKFSIFQFVNRLKVLIDSKLTGPIVTSDITDGQVTYAKIQDVSAASRLLGRGDSGAGDVQEITLGTNLSISGVTLNASGSGTTPTGTGFRHVTTGVEDAASKLVDTADINNDQVTYAKIQNISTASRLLGRGSAAGSGDTEELTLGTNLSLAGTVLNASGGAGASWLTVEANFGSTPVSRGSFTITDAAISGSSKIIIQQAPGPYTGKGTRADEAEMDQIYVTAEPGSGSATARWKVVGSIVPEPKNGYGATNAIGGVGRPNLQVAQASIGFIQRSIMIGRVKGNFKFFYTVA